MANGTLQPGDRLCWESSIPTRYGEVLYRIDADEKIRVNKGPNERDDAGMPTPAYVVQMDDGDIKILAWTVVESHPWVPCPGSHRVVDGQWQRKRDA